MTAIDTLFAAMQKAKGLPALEETVTSILDSLGDIRLGNRDIAARILDDVALTQKILKLANSAMYAPFARGVSNVSSALNVLGADALLHLVLGTTLIGATELKNDDALAKPMLAGALARKACPGRMEDVGIAALMHDTGRLMASHFLPAEMADLAMRLAHGEEQEAAEKAVLGMTLAQLGAAIAVRWRLPGAVVSIIDGSGDPFLIDIAGMANAVAGYIQAGDAAAALSRIAAFDAPGLDKVALQQMAEEKIQQQARAVAAPVPVSADATATDATAVDVADSAPASVPASAPATVTPAAAIPLAPAVAAPVSAPSPRTAAGLGQLLSTLTTQQAGSLADLATALLPPLAQLLDAAHCLIFLANRSGDFAIRHGHGADLEELKGKLRLPAVFRPTVFQAAVKSRSDIVIGDVSKLNDGVLPDRFRLLLPRTRAFLLLPIVAGERTAGLLYCDWNRLRELDANELASLRQLRDLFVKLV